MCFACRSAEKVQRNKHVETHYRTPIRSIAHSRKGTFAPLSMAAMSVAPISRHTRSFGARCYSTDVEVADTFCFKMITRVYEVKRINMILLSPREIGLSFSPHIPDFQVVKKCLDLEKIQARWRAAILTIRRGRTANAWIGAKCWFSHDQSSYYSNCQRSLSHHLDQVGAIIRGTMKIVQQAVGRNRDLVECGGRPVRLQGRLDRRDPHDAAL